jgi:competence protein ComEA
MTSWLRVLIGGMLVAATYLLPRHGSEVPLISLAKAAEAADDSVVCVGCNPLVFGRKLNVNTAPREHLELLPNIGPKRAQVIVSTRQHMVFETLEDLDDVRGIGPKTLRQLEPLVVFE